MPSIIKTKEKQSEHTCISLTLGFSDLKHSEHRLNRIDYTASTADGTLTVIMFLLFVLICSGAQLESLMETMRAEIANQPPVEGAFSPQRGDYCIAKFTDGEW